MIRSLLTERTTTFEGRSYQLARRLVRAQGAAAAAPADRDRWQGRAADAPARGPLRRPLELLREDPEEFGRLRERLGELCEAEGRAAGGHRAVRRWSGRTPTAPARWSTRSAAFDDGRRDQWLLVGFPRPYDPARSLEPAGRPHAVRRPWPPDAGRPSSARAGTPTSAVGEDDGPALKRAALERGEGGRDLVEPVGRDGRLEDGRTGPGRSRSRRSVMLPHIDVDSSTSNFVDQKLQGMAPPATPTSMIRPALGSSPRPASASPRCPTRSSVRSTPSPCVRSWIASAAPGPGLTTWWAPSDVAWASASGLESTAITVDGDTARRICTARWPRPPMPITVTTEPGVQGRVASA